MPMSAFLLHLYGPMQSWADTGFGQLREAGEFPSRAAVLGMIAAAQGIPRADERLLTLHDNLRVHTATRRPGRILRDFHTVETREGRPRTLTSRDYHHDAHFVALIEGYDDEAVTAAENALRRPIFSTFLGRRACPPAVPLLPEAVSKDPFDSLLRTTLATADTLPRSTLPGKRRWGRSEEKLTVWLDGHFSEAEIPAAFGTPASITYGSRRARLVGPRRAYASAPFTRVRLQIPLRPADPHDLPMDPDNHQTYFDAAS